MSILLAVPQLALVYDTLLLLQQGELMKAGINVLINLVVCILGVWLAMVLVKVN
jgi:CrcB protein